MSTENTNDDHQPAGLGAMTGSAFWVLFEHMSQEHGLTLLDSELSDICHAVDRMREKWKADEAKRRCRTCWGSGQVEIQSGPYYRTCDACGGSGQNVQRLAHADENLNHTEKCPIHLPCAPKRLMACCQHALVLCSSLGALPMGDESPIQ